MADFKFRDLRADEIECRVSTINEKGLTLLLYKDARCDMNILDETIGPMNWQREHSRENANCTVSVWDPDKTQWISKEDTGTESNTEAEKGLASDSFKRACFNWGIGRELYTAPRIWLSRECYNPDSKNGKPITYDRFKVSEITIEEKKITALKILNETNGEIVFTYSNGKTKITKSQRKTTRQASEPAQAQAPTYRDQLREFCKKYDVPTQTIIATCGLNKESTEKDYQAALSYAQTIARR